MKVILKACPFCGEAMGEADTTEHPPGLCNFGCTECWGMGPEGETWAKAIEKWNIRTPSEHIAGHKPCPFCGEQALLDPTYIYSQMDFPYCNGCKMIGPTSKAERDRVRRSPRPRTLEEYQRIKYAYLVMNQHGRLSAWEDHEDAGKEMQRLKTLQIANDVYSVYQLRIFPKEGEA